MFGLIGAGGCWILLSKDMFFGVWRRVMGSSKARSKDDSQGHAAEEDPFSDAREGQWMVYHDTLVCHIDLDVSATMQTEHVHSRMKEKKRMLTLDLLRGSVTREKLRCCAGNCCNFKSERGRS